MKAKFKYFLLAFAGVSALIFSSCKEDEADTLSRLFMPEFLKNSYDIQGTSIKYVWQTSTDAALYRIELSDAEDFSTVLDYGETAKGQHTFTGLNFNTGYWARVKALSAYPDTGESKWSYADAVTTLSRTIPVILYEVDAADTEMTAVTVRWNTEMLAEYPVDRLSYVPALGGTEVNVDLSAAQAAAGSYLIEGLTSNTQYRATLYNMQMPEGDRHYNTVTFKTAGAPEGATFIAGQDDLYAKIVADMADAGKSELNYYLEAGARHFITSNKTLDPVSGKWTPTDASFNNVTVTKSITFTAAPGERPTIYVRGGKWDFPATETFIEKIEIDGVNVKEYIAEGFAASASSYFFNIATRSANLTVDKFIVKNSDIDLPSTLWLMNTANTAGAVNKVGQFIMEDCTYTTTGGVGNTLGIFQGSAVGSDIFNDVQIRRCTFWNMPRTRGLFHRPTTAVLSVNGSIAIENCTFYFISTVTASSPAGSGFPLVDLQSFDKNMNVSIKKCLFSNQIQGPVRLHANNAGDFVHNDNYYTSDMGNNGNGAQTSTIKGYIDDMVSAGLSPGELFSDPANGDFTIKAKTSAVYTQGIGDPRWIK